MLPKYAGIHSPYNILSGGWGRKLLEATLVKNLGSVGYATRSFHASLRYCTVKGERSGGAVVDVISNKEYDHTFSHKTFERRLPAGFSDKRLIMALGRCINECRDYHEIANLREKVYQLAENGTLPNDQLTALADHYDVECAYTDMTEDDCRFWLKTIKYAIKSDHFWKEKDK